MSLSGELRQHLWAVAILDPELEWMPQIGWIRSRPGRPARQFGRRLDVHTAVDQSGDCLQIPLRLTIAAWCAADQHRSSAGFSDQVAIQCVHRLFAGGIDIRMTLV